MTTTTLQAGTSNKRLLALLVLLLLSSVGVFGQEAAVSIEAPKQIAVTVIAADSDDNSQMELVSWFMASKQSQNVNAAKDFNAISTNGNGKKQMINSGTTPNRILSRTFLKKAINHESTIA